MNFRAEEAVREGAVVKIRREQPEFHRSGRFSGVFFSMQEIAGAYLFPN